MMGAPTEELTVRRYRGMNRKGSAKSTVLVGLRKYGPINAKELYFRLHDDGVCPGGYVKLYRALFEACRENLAQSCPVQSGSRKIYEITPQGKSRLDQRWASVADAERGGSDPPSLIVGLGKLARVDRMKRLAATLNAN
jgi:DNA-binding PadR family transcriptional regulator